MGAVVAWCWRTVPKFSMGDSDSGIEPGEEDAKKAAEDALVNPQTIAAIVTPIGLILGQWKALGWASIGLRTYNGTVRWHDDVHGRGVAHQAARDADASRAP
jgi:hypothetical protein